MIKRFLLEPIIGALFVPPLLVGFVYEYCVTGFRAGRVAMASWVERFFRTDA